MIWPAVCSLSMGQVIEKRNLHPKNIDMFGQPSLELQVISFHILAFTKFLNLYPYEDCSSYQRKK
jgi:hypothetical protein